MGGFVLLSPACIAAVSSMAVLAFVICMHRRSKDKIEESILVDELMNASENGYVIFDEHQKFLKSNLQAERQLRYLVDGPIKDLTKSDFINHLYDYATDVDTNIKASVMSGGAPDNVPAFREVISLSDDTLCVVNARQLNAGKTLFTLVDVSIGKDREESLQKLNIINNHLIQAIQSTTTGIAISDPKQDDNPIIFANDAFCVFANKTPQELIGANWGSVMPLVIDGVSQKKILQGLERNEATEVEVETRHHNQSRHYSMSLSPIYDDGDVLDLFICLTYDVTLLKQREAEFFHSQKLKSLGQLAAGIAHDFNNVLSIISGYAEMASRQFDKDPEKIKNYLGKIETAANKGSGLTRKMLTFTRHKIIAKECLDVRAVTEEQSSLLVPLLGSTVNMSVTMPDEELKIYGDSSSIGQIIMNLAINARDAMPDGGKLDISLGACEQDSLPENVAFKVDDADEFVVISVSDTGVGMDRKTMERIFDPFFSTKEQGKGTGLGMSVVYGLVNELGGVLDVDSEQGAGTKITVYIPRAYEELTKSVSGNPDEVDTIKLTGYTALVVEDEQDLLEVVTNMASELGLKVLTAENGDEALAVQDDYDGAIDVLITDVSMPGINGVKLAELVQSLRSDIKVVYMSGYPANGNMAPVELPKGATFMAKPIRYADFARAIYSELKSQDGASKDDQVSRWKTSEDQAMGGVS